MAKKSRRKQASPVRRHTRPPFIADAVARLERLKHAYGLLGSAECGEWRIWSGPANPEPLLIRIQTVALLANLIPRSALSELENVITAWCAEFPRESPVSYGELRTAAQVVLRRVPEVSGGKGAGEQLLASAMRSWKQQLLESPRWTHLPAIVPGEPATPIDQAYVELFAVAEDGVEQVWAESLRDLRQRRRRAAHDSSPQVSVAAMAARTLEQCIVLGPPGSGKSTLVQWLAREVALDKLPDFEAALVIKLSAYARELARRPRLSLVDFFLQSLDPGPQDWSQAAELLRRQAQATRRYLLLLDGWDEIPHASRDAVLEQIRREQPNFIVVVTSRPSGLPRQLGGVVKTDFYEIAGLAPRAREAVLSNQLRKLGRLDLESDLTRRLEENADLREMAANPFLLGLLVRVMTRAGPGESPPDSLAAVYDQVTAWICEQYAQAAPSGVQLTSRHLDGLQRLSYALLFAREDATYLFTWRELTRWLDGVADEPVWRSRFVHRTHPVFDEFGFLHATFQEYFSALHLSALPPEEYERETTRAFHSLSRLVVLEFAAGGAGEPARRLRALAGQWLKAGDRFQQVLLRVARLAAAGRWRDSGLMQALYDQLWSVISGQESISPMHEALLATAKLATSGRWRGAQQSKAVCDELARAVASQDEMLSVQKAVEAFAALAPEELVSRVRNLGERPTWLLNCLVEAIPATQARKLRLIELLPESWQAYSTADLGGEIAPAHAAGMLSALSDPSRSEADRREAIQFVGAARMTEAAPALIRLLSDAAAPVSLREETIDSLAALGDRASVDALVDLVTGRISLSPQGIRSAAAALRNTTVGRKALDPSGRDRLLRQIAILDFEAPQAVYALGALEGHPIRDGGELLADFVAAEKVDEAAAEQAAVTLETVADRTLLARVVTRITSEQRRSVASALLELAIKRRLAIPLDWLEKQLSLPQNRMETHRLLKRYVQTVAQLEGAERERGAEILHQMFAVALGGTETEEREALAKGLTAALAGFRTLERRYLRLDTLGLAKSALRRFCEDPSGPADGQVLLAARLAEEFAGGGAEPDLAQALATATALPFTSSQRGARLGYALASSLVRLNPGILLEYPLDCVPVQAALHRATNEQGWLIFEERILDAEGREVATRAPTAEAIPAAEEVRAQPADSLLPLGADSKRMLGQLLVFYRIGAEYTRGATSMSQIARSLGATDGAGASSVAALSKACTAVRRFFATHDQTDQELFVEGIRGQPREGLTDYGKSVWRRVEAFLRGLKAIE